MVPGTSRRQVAPRLGILGIQFHASEHRENSRTDAVYNLHVLATLLFSVMKAHSDRPIARGNLT